MEACQACFAGGVVSERLPRESECAGFPIESAILSDVEGGSTCFCEKLIAGRCVCPCVCVCVSGSGSESGVAVMLFSLEVNVPPS